MPLIDPDKAQAQYDVIVVGSGAAGGQTAYTCALEGAKVLIVDFGSQVTQLIARRVREAGVYSEIAPFNQAEAAFDRMQPKGIILSGSPFSVMRIGSW